jgi:hypothetical protein
MLIPFLSPIAKKARYGYFYTQGHVGVSWSKEKHLFLEAKKIETLRKGIFILIVNCKNL